MASAMARSHTKTHEEPSTDAVPAPRVQRRAPARLPANPALVAVGVLLVLTVVGVAAQSALLAGAASLILAAGVAAALAVGLWSPRRGIGIAGAVVVAAGAASIAYAVDPGVPAVQLGGAAAIALALGCVAVWAGGVLHRVHRRMVESRRMVEAMTQIDPTTGVFKAAAGRERLRVEVARAVRYRRPFSLLIGKPHDWRGEIERRGIESAQEIYAETVRTAATTLRQNDIVATEPDYSFLVILPETDAAGGEIAAGHIQRATKGLLDLHFGLVQCPDDGTTEEALLREAYQALSFAAMTNLPLVSRNALLGDETA